MHFKIACAFRSFAAMFSFFPYVPVLVLLACSMLSKAQSGLVNSTDSTPANSSGLFSDPIKKDLLLVQFSGVVVSGHNLEPVPFTHIIVKDTHRGTAADVFGYFSFVAKEGDTILFSALGFQPSEFRIPDSLSDKRYSLIQMMQSDTILLKEAVIYPWPSKEDFTRAFLALELPDDDLQRARRNLEREKMHKQSRNLPMDGTENFRHAMQQQQSQLYYAGQAPPNHLLNPLAWASFIEAWKNGDFKKQE